MKKVIILTYYWPPSGGPAVQRWLFFSNELARHGFEVHVLTPDPANATFPVTDVSLLKKVDPAINVHCIPLRDAFALYKKVIGKGKAPAAGFSNEETTFVKKIARFVRGNFIFPDPRSGWNKGAVKKAAELIEAHSIKNIISAGPPHSTHLIAGRLKKQFGSELNWIADFHDAWTDIWFYGKLYKTALAKRIDNKMERNVLDTADHVLTVGEFLLDKLHSKSGKSRNDFHLVSMGFDDSINYTRETVKNEILTICYTGTIDTDYEPSVLFNAISDLKAEGIFIRLSFTGITAPEIRDLAQKFEISELTRFNGYADHQEIPGILAAADLLLLISPKVVSEEIIIPGKIYEYLATRKPIINIGSKASNTAAIIRECDAGINIERTELAALMDYLRAKHGEFTRNDNRLTANSSETYLKYARSLEALKVEKLLRVGQPD